MLESCWNFILSESRLALQNLSGSLKEVSFRILQSVQSCDLIPLTLGTRGKK